MDSGNVENKENNDEKRRIRQDKINEHRRKKKLDNPDYDKPKDPEYFKKYYLDKLQGVKCHCECCNVDVFKHSKSKHEKTKAHVRNELIFNIRKEPTKYNIDDFVKERISGFKKYCKICDKSFTKFSSHTKSEIHILREKLNNLENNLC